MTGATEEGLLADLQLLRDDGSRTTKLEACAAVLALEPVRFATSHGVRAAKAVITLLTLVADKAIAEHQSDVENAAELTGIVPRHEGQGVRDDKGIGDREKEVAERIDCSVRTVFNRTPRYLRAYADAVLEFVDQVKQDDAAMADFLCKCGLAESTVRQLAAQASQPDPRSEFPPSGGSSERVPAGLLASLLSLSGGVQEALDAARASCRAKHRACYTSDMLIALLDMPKSRVADCFDEAGKHAGKHLARDVRRYLQDVIDQTPRPDFDPPMPATWAEYPDIQRAWRLTLQDAGHPITEVYLLLAILDGTSNTKLRLVAFLGDDFGRVREIANRKRREPPPTLRTP